MRFVRLALLTACHISLMCPPCLAAGEGEPTFYTLRLAVGIVLGAGCWIIANRFPKYDQRIPAILALAGFFVGYFAGLALLVLLLSAGGLAGLGFLLFKKGPALSSRFHQWNQQRLERIDELSRPCLADRIRELTEKRDRDLDAIEDLESIDEGNRQFLLTQVRLKYEESLRNAALEGRT